MNRHKFKFFWPKHIFEPTNQGGSTDTPSTEEDLMKTTEPAIPVQPEKAPEPIEPQEAAPEPQEVAPEEKETTTATEELVTEPTYTQEEIKGAVESKQTEPQQENTATGGEAAAEELVATEEEKASETASTEAGEATAAAETTATADSSDAPAIDVDYLVCKNPILDTNKFRDGKVISTEKWKVVQANVLQRHFDRWMYAHDILDNKCWPHQLNSTQDTMEHQCEDTERSSIWNTKDFIGDPYAAPEKGYCNAKQLTLQGATHAEKLGGMLKHAYLNTDTESTGTPLFEGLCTPETVSLSSEDALKNQLTLQSVYKGLCGDLPTVEAYPAAKVISDGTPKRSTPFHIYPKICNGTQLARLNKLGQEVKTTSAMWGEISDVAKQVATIADHTKTVESDTERSAELLDAVYDCMVSHACHGLGDTPEQLANLHTANAIDEYETKSRTFTFTYLKEQNQTELELYRKLTFGYYFRFLMDKMMDVTEKAKGPKLSIEVVADSTLTTVLAMLSARDSKTHEHRPPWGSTIVFEVYQSVDTSAEAVSDEGTNVVKEYAVGVTYNGNLLDVCEPNDNADLPDGACTWQQWMELVEVLSPSPEECPTFYIYYGKVQ
ncbi:hypothetical protein SARC_08266 [Sphaeroforma arctica JP610]|uniref:Uncharacterized protein n=1 Tax=Sphaeroforma arctica JP610 TaxID=667725 RepID=A0A0L0FRM8_9EUKA|nr:hypothetical protein SARC_08266 [Sphaeroforma arctica JP610]KNC79344.1 hypothetical protein SARC_08266 [Sphaeroforma arctica JP610]|eukprot:XP_014153246.1 hypothetical protein SARC_08266 [Sphaeroforma arctica JP610]